MSQLLQIGTRAVAGQVTTLDGVAGPTYFDQGIPFMSNGAVAVDDAGVIDHHWQGLPFTAVGRLAVAIGGVVSRVESSAPFTAAGLLVFGIGAVDHFSHGIPYTITGQIKTV